MGIKNDEVIDSKLKEFFNKYEVTGSVSDIGSGFSLLSLDKKLKIFEEYLMYFFTYVFSSNGAYFKIHQGVDKEHITRFNNSTHVGLAQYKDLSYDIDTQNKDEDGESMDTFSLTIYYFQNGQDRIITQCHLWISYDMFEMASIGFDFEGDINDYDIREKLREIFKRVYDKIMEDDVLHAWYYFKDMEGTLQDMLLKF